MVEGLPGSGKSATAHGIATWLADQQVAVELYAEGRVDHPVDLEQVAVLTAEDVLLISAELPETSQALLGAAERRGELWLVRHPLHPTLPDVLVDRLRRHDASDGAVPGDGRWDDHTAAVRAFVADPLGLDRDPGPRQVA